MKVRVLDTEGYMPVSATPRWRKSPTRRWLRFSRVLTPPTVTAASRSWIMRCSSWAGRYRYGGSDPHSGVDRSGFTRYVPERGRRWDEPFLRFSGSPGISHQRGSDAARRSFCFTATADGSTMWRCTLGNGQIVHASTGADGESPSPWNYRDPCEDTSMLGQTDCQ